MNWLESKLETLKSLEVWQLCELRQRIFVVEQHCPYPDIDETDLLAWHLLGHDENRLIAYARIFAEKDVARIGRIVIHPEKRRKGLGKDLIHRCLGFTQKTFPGLPIELSAQWHLKEYYVAFGFKSVSEMYLEDGIPHLRMRK